MSELINQEVARVDSNDVSSTPDDQRLAAQTALSILQRKGRIRRNLFISLGAVALYVFSGVYGCDSGPKHKVEIEKRRIELAKKTVDLDKKKVEEIIPKTTPLEQKLEKALTVKETKVVFVLDSSGSMEGEKMEALKKEMGKAVNKLQDTQMFDMIDFDDSIIPWKNGLQSAKTAERQDAKDWVSQLQADGSTYVFEAIKEAFQRKEVEALVLVSDGRPSDGAPDEIRDWVKQNNQGRGIKIHTVAILLDQGLGSQEELFLEGLAKDTGGDFTPIRREEATPEEQK